MSPKNRSFLRKISPEQYKFKKIYQNRRNKKRLIKF